MNSGAALLPQEVECKNSRPTANFPPSVWGDFFLKNIDDQSQSQDADEERLINELVEEIRRELVLQTITKTSVQEQLQLIDSIQRLGVAYHFQTEINDALQTLFKTYDTDDWNDDLYSAALSFRLLRQQGYRVSCSVFEKFKGGDGKFKDSITSDVKGMLAFYEATFLNVDGENILDEGRDFALSHLNTMKLNNSSNNIGDYVEQLISHALKQQPYWRGIPRVESRAFISIYDKHDSHNKTLLRLAKLDFNRLQSQYYKREVAIICRWWKQLDVPNKIPFTRDRAAECYFWATSVFFEPQYSAARIFLARMLATLTIIDDIYDAYGTFEEVEIFTEAIERWSLECLDWLPIEPLKIGYKTLLELFQEMEQEMAKQGTLFCMDYAKKMMKVTSKGYFAEAEWRKRKYVPTLDEYLDVAIKSASYPTLIVTSYSLMGDVVTKENIQWAMENPLVINASGIICRLQDDVVGHKFEKEREHVASAIDCYMNENNKATEQEAIKGLKNQIEAARKSLNEGFLAASSEQIPLPMLYCVINFARFIEVVYKDSDGYTHVPPKVQSYIRQVLIDPIPAE